MNFSLLLSYVFLGLTLAAPIGPVNSAEIDKGIKNGFFHAWMVGVGAIIADAIFMILIFLGLTHFLDIPIIQIFLWLFGAFVLLYTGIESITKGKTITFQNNRQKESIISCFFTGFIMSISSPLSIMFWLGIYGSVLAKTAATYETSQVILYSSMIFLGLSLWDLFIAAISSGTRRFLSSKMLQTISFLSGASLIGFGIYFGYQGIKSLFF